MRIKSKSRILLPIIIMMLAVIMCSSITQASSEEESEILTVGYVWNYGTMSVTPLEDSKGYGYEYLQELMKYTVGNYELDFVECQWNESFDLLRSGEIDLLGSISYTPERGKEFLYSNSFGDEALYITAAEDDPTHYNDFDTMNNRSIGVLKNCAGLPKLYAYLEENNIDCSIYETNRINDLEALKYSKLDYYLSSSLQEGEGLKVIAKLGSEPIYYITNSQNATLMNDLNNAMIRLNQENNLYEEKLYFKYFEEGLNNAIDITAGEYELLREDTYKVGFIENYAPLSYTTGDGELTGIFIETINYISEVSGIEIEYVEMTSDSQVNEELDFWVSTKTDKAGQYSDPYTFFPFVLVEHENQNHNDPQIVGALNYYDFAKTGLEKAASFSGIKQYDHVEELVEAYNDKQVTTMVMTSFELNLIREEIKDRYVGNVLNPGINMRIAYSEEFSPDKIGSINQLLKSVDEDEKEYLLVKHASYHAAEKKSYWEEHQKLVWSILVLLGVILYIIFSIRKKYQLTRLLNYDELTDTYTKAGFQKKVRGILDKKIDETYMLYSIDIDNFKYINEMYGYEVGTEVLKIFAQQIREISNSKAIVARIDGDNFLVFSSKIMGEEAIARSNNHWAAITGKTSHLLGKEYPLRFSVGIYYIKDSKVSIDHMIDCANLARKEGKQHVGTSIEYFTEDINLARQINNEVIIKMDKALENHDFVLYYQPKVHLSTQKVIGAEALVRWIDNGKLVSPHHFIPLFEKNGFIEKLDYYVIEEVCRFLVTNDNWKLPIISINISGITILKNDVVESIIGILNKYQIQPEQIDLEITESAFVGSFDKAISNIDALRSEGFTISMDDFGAGISSLNRLKEINFDILKIDRGFVVDTLDNPKGTKIIKSVINMSKELHVETVAEGIETQEQLEFLKNLGCDVGQGYYFSRPLPEEKFLVYLKK